jgi:uridine kinase
MLETVILGIAGGTASGKTTLAQTLADRGGSEQIVVLELDRYYLSQSNLSPTDRESVNYDHPDTLEFELLVQHLKSLKAGNSIMAPIYDFTTHCRDPLKFSHIHPRPLIIVEGILTFAYSELLNLFDFKIFVDTPKEVRFSRRLERDTRLRGRSIVSVNKQWNTTVQPMHLKFCEPGKVYADRVIDGQSNFETLAEELLIDLWSALRRK